MEEFIEPDFGLLDLLLGLGVLSRRQFDDVCSEKRGAYRRTQAVLDLITSEEHCHMLLRALEKTGQQHVANFITQNGGEKIMFLRRVHRVEFVLQSLGWFHSQHYFPCFDH